MANSPWVLYNALKTLETAQKVEKPKIIYCDNETAWSVGAVPIYLKEQGIKQYITRNHAQFAERFIRTYKGMLYKRMDSAMRDEVQGIKPKEKPKEKPKAKAKAKSKAKPEEEEEEEENPNLQWETLNEQILLTYNNSQVHSTIKMTPLQAIRDSNQIDVKNNIEIKANKNRRYPPLEVGDSVKIRRKKKVNEKERTSNWGDEEYKVISIEREFGQKYYTLDKEKRQYTRGEVLKV
jgi:hypothetical protein